ncbi:hypothetical protein [Bathymodiolus japonicus methanotrophic gill symbiont]|nr:hypothetical protein [Bathymodiolus japonicus methanotrophic gill symbiont]
MLLVTSSITVPVGFFFYMPDPALKQWDNGEHTANELCLLG